MRTKSELLCHINKQSKFVQYQQHVALEKKNNNQFKCSWNWIEIYFGNRTYKYSDNSYAILWDVRIMNLDISVIPKNSIDFYKSKFLLGISYFLHFKSGHHSFPIFFSSEILNF